MTRRTYAAPEPEPAPALVVTPEADVHEHEADAVADGRGAPRPLRRAAAATGDPVDPNVAQAIRATRGRGRKLPSDIRRPAERSLGRNLDSVRIHTDHRSDQLNRLLQARAFTTGQDIYFRHGEYVPTTPTGRHTLTHELTHVAQQASTSPGPDAPAVVQRVRTRGQARKEKASEEEEAERKEKAKKAKKAKRSGPGSKSEADEETKDVGAEAEAMEEEDDAVTTTDSFGNTVRNLPAMRKLLAGQGLAADRPRKPVSIGAVVWNVNHLSEEKPPKAPKPQKAAPTTTTTATTPQATNRRKVRGKRKGTGTRATTPKPPTPTMAETRGEVDVEDHLLGPLDNLKAALAVMEVEVADLKRRSEKRKRPEGERKSDLSQFATDVGVMSGLDLTAASKQLAEVFEGEHPDLGTRPVTTEASDLHKLRQVHTLWNRVDRVRRMMVTGNPTKKRNKDIQAALRKVGRNKPGPVTGTELEPSEGPPPTAADVIDETTGELLRLVPLETVAREVTTHKKALVERLTSDTFLRNPGIDLVLLNELNQAGGWLEHIGRLENVGVSAGPEMLAKGRMTVKVPKAGPRKGRKTGDADAPASSPVEPIVSYTGRQHEYYSAFFRKKGDDAVSAKGSFYVTTGGGFIVQDPKGGKGGKQGDGLKIPWNKATQSYRGIVVHRLVKNGEEFWAGVIHTTPFGKSLHRSKIWPQIETALAALGELADAFEVPLLVGGDFYISSEAIVDEPGDRDMGEIEKDDPGHVRRQMVGHYLRNLFLLAELRGHTGRLMERLVGTRPPSTPVPEPPPVTWKEYSEKAKDKVDELVEGEARLEQMYEHLAPRAEGKDELDRAYAGVDWADTRSAGKIKPSDLVRNTSRFDLTLTHAVAPLGYRVVDSSASTNPKEKGKGEDKEQLADLFLVNDHWKTTGSGIVLPDTRELVPADSSQLTATHSYWDISDHSPPAMLASTTPDDVSLFKRYQLHPDAPNQARDRTVISWKAHAARVAKAASEASSAVDLSVFVDLIGTLVATPWTETSPARSETLRDAITALAGEVDKLKPTDRSLAGDVRGWMPYFAKDVTLDPTWRRPPSTSTSGGPQGKDPGSQGEDTGSPDKDPRSQGLGSWGPSNWGLGNLGLGNFGLGSLGLGKWNPRNWRLGNLGLGNLGLGNLGLGTWGRGNKGPASTGPGSKAEEEPGADPMVESHDPPATVFPTGEIEHFLNSCYLAALLFLLDSHDELRNTLDARHLPVQNRSDADRRRIAALRDASTLPQLVGRLHQPGAVITQSAIAGLMGQLVVQGLVTGHHAFGGQQDVAEVLQNILGLLEPGPALQHETQDRFDPLDRRPTRYGGPQSESTLQLEIDDVGIDSIESALIRKAAAEDMTLEVEGQVKKTTEITRLPTVLVVVLKRFRGGLGQPTVKLVKPVSAPDELKIPDQCLTPGLRGRAITYTLRHVVHHQGRFGDGHYTSFGKLADDRWFHHNDTRADQRLKELDRGVRPKEIDEGYVYVYVRRQQQQPQQLRPDAMQL